MGLRADIDDEIRMIASDRRRVGRVFLSELVSLGLVLGACAEHSAAADDDWASARLVTVRLIDDRFVPDKFVFRRGVPYHLRLENDGADVHEFTAPEFFGTLAIGNPEVLEPGRHEVFLQPNERKDLYFVARTPGRYGLTCANHDWDGMTGEITVE